MVLHPLLGQRRGERIEPLLERLRDFERVGAELSRCFNENARLAADQCIAETRLGALAQCGDIAQTHRQAAARADHRLRQGVERGAGGLGLDHDALRRRLDVSAADQGGRPPGGGHDIVESEPGRGELCRVDLDLPLAHLAAENLRLRHTGNREDLRLDDPLHHVSQLHRREPIAGVAEMHQVFHG